MNEIFPLVLRFEVLQRWVNADRPAARRVSAGLALANGEDFCEAFLSGSVRVGPANIYLASDGDGLGGERSASQGKGERKDVARRDKPGSSRCHLA